MDGIAIHYVFKDTVAIGVILTTPTLFCPYYVVYTLTRTCGVINTLTVSHVLSYTPSL